jgi:hypothetical protein
MVPFSKGRFLHGERLFSWGQFEAEVAASAQKREIA